MMQALLVWTYLRLRCQMCLQGIEGEGAGTGFLVRFCAFVKLDHTFPLQHHLRQLIPSLLALNFLV